MTRNRKRKRSFKSFPIWIAAQRNHQFIPPHHLQTSHLPSFQRLSLASLKPNLPIHIQLLRYEHRVPCARQPWIRALDHAALAAPDHPLACALALQTAVYHGRVAETVATEACLAAVVAVAAAAAVTVVAEAVAVATVAVAVAVGATAAAEAGAEAGAESEVVAEIVENLANRLLREAQR